MLLAELRPWEGRRAGGRGSDKDQDNLVTYIGDCDTTKFLDLLTHHQFSPSVGHLLTAYCQRASTQCGDVPGLV